jgi:BlaI family transcriptional regulator, penicillinase repressor
VDVPDDGSRLNPRELDVMRILWRAGSGTVGEVRAQLTSPPAYATVLGVLQTLKEKGCTRREKEGRAYRFYPVMEPADAGGNALGRVLDRVFHGPAPMLLAPDELRRMRDLQDRRRAEEEEER